MLAFPQSKRPIPAHVPERRRALGGLACLAATALVGCGGGDGGGPGLDPGGDPGPGPGPGGDPGGAFMTADERFASTNRITLKYQALLAGAPVNRWAELKAFVLAQPEYVEAEVGQDALWARFKDGRQFLFTDNWAPLSRPLDPSVLAPAALRTRAAAGGKPEVPGSDVAVFLAADDQGTFDYGKTAQSTVADMLKERDWDIAPQRALTIDTLLALGGTSIGILYLTAHSAVIGPLGQRQFGVITETVSSDALDQQYKALLDSGDIIYHRNRNPLREMWADQQRPRYGITDAFVSKHLTLSPNSLVVMLSCESGSDEAAGFRQALTNAGAGTIIGWAGQSNDVGHMAMKVMFDRLTAADAVDPQDPPNRAFDLEAVWDYLGQRGYEEGGVAYTTNLLVTPNAEAGKPPAFVKRFGSGFDLTNPVITDLEATWKDKLYIHGNFGTEPGHVTVGNAAVAVTAWADDRIEVELPTGEGDPQGSCGDVVVRARKRISNTRVLTSWRGQVEYIYDILPFPGTHGRLTSTLTIDLHVRGDAHELRTVVDGVLKRSLRTFVPASDTKARYKAAGTNSGGVLTTTWSGQGDMPFRGNMLEGNSLILNGTIDAVQREFKISPALLGEGLLLQKITDAQGTKNEASYLPLYTNALGFVDAYGGDTISYGTAFRLLESGDVAPYDQRVPIPGFPPNMAAMQVRTGGLTASPPFDEGVGR